MGKPALNTAQAFLSTPTGRKTAKILAFTLVGVVLFFVIKAVGKGFVEWLESRRDDQDFDDVVTNTPTQDATIKEEGFLPQARIIADSQEVAMDGAGTADSTLFGGVVELNGAELQQVFAEFGTRQGENLFSWYAGDLGGGFPDDPIGMYSWSDYGMTEAQGEALGVGFFDTEQELMRAIWRKSGLPLSF